MNGALIRLIAIALLALLSGDCLAEWRQVKKQGGIQIYTQQIAGSALVIAKGIVTIEAKPEVILKILDNNQEHPQWIPYLQTSRKLQILSDRERLEYNLFNAPWPASNRDFVFRVKAIHSGNKNILIYRMTSEATPLMPEQKGIVRGILHESTFKLTRLEANKTEVELLFQADPRGWIPTWIVNFIQTAWPYKVLKGLRERVLR